MAKLTDINLLSIGHTIQLAGAVYIGEGIMYLAMFPEERGELFLRSNKVMFNQDSDEFTVLPLAMNQADWEQFIRQTDTLDIEALVKEPDGSIKKAILRKSQRQIEQGVSWKVFKRDEYRCRYCAADDVPLTVDHLVCWEEGGPSIVENLVSSCRKCNKTRGSLAYPKWITHQYYLKVSKNLTEAVRLANVKLVETLDTIPRMVHKRSR